MRRSKRILLLTASVGAGHVRASQALDSALARLAPEVQTRYLDVLDVLGAPAKLALALYFKSLAWAPRLYAGAYAFGNEHRTALVVRSLLSRLLARRLVSHVKEFRPDAVICTHAGAAALASEVMGSCSPECRLYGVVTDFTIHRLWICQGIARYFIAHNALTYQLTHWGVRSERIHALGIPHAPLRVYDKTALRHHCGIAPGGHVIVLVGGGYGLLPMAELIGELDQMQTPLRIVAIAGKNDALYEKLCHIGVAPQHMLTVRKFVEPLQEYMAAADLIVSKAGGLTASEALDCGVPMLIYRPLPGQEAANAAFLIQHGAALQAHHLKDFRKKIDKIFRIDDNVVEFMKIAAKKLAKPDAAEKIAVYVLNDLYK